jgi:hypothetical protein
MFFLKSKYNFWLALSIATAILFSLAGLKLAFQSPYTIQDDARQHIFWMQRFNTPDLFPEDLIADYFQSVAPLGFTYLYKTLSSLGIEPILTSKILPLILGAISTNYCFRVCWQIFPIPFAGFLAALLLNQNLWLVDDLVSGTPRAFFYPLFLAFIYYLLNFNFLACLLLIILQGFFYPHLVLFTLVLLSIRFTFLWWQSRFNWQLNQGKLFFYFSCLATALVILIIYSLQLAEFGEVISFKEAQTLPEFANDGRTAFFIANPIAFWLCAPRSGFFPREWQYVILASFGGLLPLLRLQPNNFPLVRQIKSEVIIILQILLTSIILFFFAHLFLFKLHLPSRYSQHSFRIILAITDGIVITVLLDVFLRWLKNKIQQKYLIIIILIACLLYPTYAASQYPYRLGYVTGEATSLYQFLEQQPKDYLIASLSQEADMIPSLAKRSVLISAEYAIPYHRIYYQQIQERTKDLIRAQYSINHQEIKNFIDKYKINLWLLDANFLEEKYLANNSWSRQFEPEVIEARETLSRGKIPALVQSINQCTLFQEQDLIILSAKCIKE